MQGAEKTVLVFGTFDGLHDGHRFFLEQARKLGGRLIASVAQDEIVAQIKKHPPTHPLEERLKMLEASGLVNRAVVGDKELGNWSAVRQWKPDIVAIGHDQTRLEETLRAYIQKENITLTIVKIEAKEPDRLHSRFLRKN